MATDLSEYEVRVNLKLQTNETKKPTDEAAAALRKVQNELDKTRARGHLAMSAISTSLSRMGSVASRAADTMFRLASRVAMVGAGATIAGIYAVGRGLQSFSRYGVEANSSVEGLTLSLGTLLAQTEKITFSEAREGAEDLFRRMQALAIESPGTTMELAGVFRSAVGPMRTAGIAMSRILTMSRDTLSVASALQIPMEEVGRDIGQMLGGTAGSEVKLFNRLRQMRLITQSAEEWNRVAQRAPREAANRLMAIMAQLGGPAAAAFGRTWAGATSTFSDLVQNFTRILTGPTFAIVRDALSSTNEYLLRYRSNIERTLTRIGTRIGEISGTAIRRSRNVARYIIDNYAALITRGQGIVDVIRGMVPQLTETAKKYLIIAAALKVGGGVLTAAGAALSAVSGIASIMTALGVGGAGAAAAGAAGAGAAGAAGVAGGGGIMAAIGVALAPLAALIAPVIAVLAGIATVGAMVYAAFQVAGNYISDMFTPIWRDLAATGRNLWASLRSGWATVHGVFGFLGTFIAGSVAGGFRLLVAIIRLASALWRAFNAILGTGSADMNTWIDSATRWVANMIVTIQRVVDAITWMSEKIEAFARWLEPNFMPGRGGLGQRYNRERGEATGNQRERDNAAFAGLAPRAVTVLTAPTMAVPNGRSTTNIDMRGSRIEVRQEFREADPDRIWIRMVEGLASEAIHTTTSPLVSAFSRG